MSSFNNSTDNNLSQAGMADKKDGCLVWKAASYNSGSALHPRELLRYRTGSPSYARPDLPQAELQMARSCQNRNTT